MAGNLGTAGYKVNLDTKDAQRNADKLTKGLRQQQGQAQKTGSSIASLAAKAVALGVTYIGVSRGIRALSSLVRESIELSNIQIAAETKLTLKFGEEAKSLIDLAAAMQKVTAFGDEMTIGAQAQLGFYGASKEAIEKLTPAMLDMAASGKELKTVSEILGKAMAGEVSTLKRYGIMFSDVEMEIFKTSTQMERASLLVNKMDKNWGGLAKTMRETGKGAWDAMNNAIGDSKELLGDVATKSKVAGSVINTLTTAISEAAPPSEDLAIAFDEIVKGMIQTGIVSAESIAPMLRYLKTTKAVFDIATIISPAGFIAAKGNLGVMKDEIKNEFKDLFDYLENENMGDTILAALRKAQDSIKDIQSGTQADLSHLHKRFSDDNLKHDEENAKELGGTVAAEMEAAALKSQEAFTEAFRSMSDEAHNLKSQLLGMKKPEKPGLEGDSWERGWTNQFISDTPGGKGDESAKSAADEMARYEQELAEYTAEEQRLLDEQRAIQVQAYDAMVAEGQRSFAEEQKALDAANIQELAAMQNEALAEIGQSRISNEKAALDTIAENNIEISEKFAAEMAKAGKEYNASLTSAGVALTTALDTANRSMNTLNTGANQLKTTMQEIRDMQGGRGRGDDRNADPNSIFNDTGEGEGGGTSQGNAKSGAWNGGSRNARNQMIERNGNQSRGGSPVVINVYPVRGQDEMMVAQMVEERILNLSRRNITTMAVGGLEGYRGI